LLGVSVVVLIAVLVWLFNRASRVNLTRPDSPDEKPEWMREMPPKETIAATQADGEGITLFDYDEGEQLAAPFAEQVEDILRAELSKDPALAALNIDLGTTQDGGLEIWVDGKAYTSIDQLPDERLRAAIRRASQKWQKGK
jgi:hypothetical protein